MIKEHVYNNTLKKYNTTELVSVIRELVKCLKRSVGILHTLAKLNDDEIDEFEALEEFELSECSDIAKVREYAYYASSTTDVINRVLRRCFGYAIDGEKTEQGTVDLLNKNINTVVDDWAGLTEDDIQVFNDLCTRIAADTAYVLKFEFGLAKTIEDYKENGNNELEADIDYVFRTYCDKYDIELIPECQTIVELSKIYKPILPVFDDYPELEEAFESVVGPYLADVDSNSLTLDIVKKVLNGDIKPEELYKLFENEEDLNG